MTTTKYAPSIALLPTDRVGLLPVSEIFFSIQGEGRFAGARAVFVRFGYCPLGCIWCDTRYTWDSQKLDQFVWLRPSEVVAKIADVIPEKTIGREMHLVITGGEPLVHQGLLSEFVDCVRTEASAFDWFIEIETSGTVAPSDQLMERIDWWNCSPKLSNNGRPMSENLKPEVLEILLNSSNVDFKFVIQTEGDLQSLEDHYYPLIPHDRIILMPEGTSREQIASVSRWLIPEAARRGHRFSTRLHVMAWGNERGR